MIERLLSLVLVFLSVVCTAQVRVKQIKLQVEDLGGRNENGYRNVSIRNAGKYEAQIFYPIIVADNVEVSKKINRFLLADALSANDSLNTMDALDRAIRNLVYSLDYEVTLNTSELLSINITRESCGVDCASTTLYYNFDVTNGEQLTIDDVVDNVEAFRRVVHADKVSALKEYKGSVDSTDKSAATMAAAFVDRCSAEANLSKFSISKKWLQVIDDCVLPDFPKESHPVYTLKYDFKKYSKLIKMKKLLSVQ